MTEIEQTIEREWQVLRQAHQAPVEELREQAAALGETCVTAARLALRGFERAESRLAALESDLQARMAQLSRDVQSLLADSHGAMLPRPHSLTPFPLERVMRIHEELRSSEQTADGGKLAETTAAHDRRAPDNGRHPAHVNGERRPAGLDAFHQSSPIVANVASPAALIRSAPPAPAATVPPTPTVWTPVDAAPAQRPEAPRWTSRRTLIALTALGCAAAIFAIVIERRISAQLDTAASRVTAAERQASLATDAAAQTRTDAQRQVAEARDAALQSQIVGSVLASPDLRRFTLSGRNAAAAASAQVLVSRSRGLVVSATRLPPAQAGSAYQAWLLTNAGPVNAGAIEPDSAGRATLAIDALPRLAGPITGALVTLEPPGRRAAPAGPVALAYAVQ